MVPTAFASEMTNAIRDFGTGVEARIAKDIQVPTTQVLGLIAFALRASSSLLVSDAGRAADRFPMPNGFAIVDKSLTRC